MVLSQMQANENLSNISAKRKLGNSKIMMEKNFILIIFIHHDQQTVNNYNNILRNWFCYYAAYSRVIFSQRSLVLNEDNKKVIWKKIQSTGDLLQPLLKPSPFHPKGRNAYAHIALCIKEKFGLSYKDIPDEKYEEVILFIEYLLANPD